MSVLHLRGHLRVVGEEELSRLTEQLLSLLGPALAHHAGHVVDVVFSSDPAQTPAAIETFADPGRARRAPQTLIWAMSSPSGSGTCRRTLAPKRCIW